MVYLLTYNRLSNRRLPATASLFLETKNFLLWTLAETYLSQSSLENHHRDQASEYLTVSKTDLWLPTLIINYESRCIHLYFYKLNLVMLLYSKSLWSHKRAPCFWYVTSISCSNQDYTEQSPKNVAFLNFVLFVAPKLEHLEG